SRWGLCFLNFVLLSYRRCRVSRSPLPVHSSPHSSRSGARVNSAACVPAPSHSTSILVAAVAARPKTAPLSRPSPLALCLRLRPCIPQVPARRRRDLTRPLPFLAHHEPLRPNARLLPFSTPSAAAVTLPTLFALVSHLFRPSPPAVRGVPNAYTQARVAHLPLATAHLSPSRVQTAE
ncbi:hypothetical protein P171DRAFT_395181, partial [Karstenula rhodostoma CBS 690.94]